ncbi:uncharacterized protein LOC125378356 [Haliotis rufescens]|uniref:uncharacterized protein LOC125378356 n=1 Tax=Haliotis rufescens TaxID=6454 RepID=UPI00201E8523|nr:uncharacterized protein LOC125378356 [Haliotis rufescens]
MLSLVLVLCIACRPALTYSQPGAPAAVTTAFPLVCSNGGMLDANTNRCQCSGGYSGERCENYVAITAAPPFVCLNGGVRIVNTNRCQCSGGYSGERCEKCIQCHNAAECSKDTKNNIICSCYPPTSGDRCDGTTTSSISNNIARNRKAFHCRSGENGTNYGDDTIWTGDVCYDLHVNNVIIIDLGGQYQVQTVHLKKHGHQNVNLTIRVGLHPADQCAVMRGINCTAYNRHWPNGTEKAFLCNKTQSKPGRYIVIENNVQAKSIFCIVNVEGMAASVSKRTAIYTNANAISHFTAVPSFSTINTQTRLACAVSCLQEPKCLNFQWTDPTCSLYGGTTWLGHNNRDVYRLQNFHQT